MVLKETIALTMFGADKDKDGQEAGGDGLLGLMAVLKLRL